MMIVPWFGDSAGGVDPRILKGNQTMVRGLVTMAVMVAAITTTGCAKPPAPEKPSTVDAGLSPKERAMQGMPANMQNKYKDKK